MRYGMIFQQLRNPDRDTARLSGSERDAVKRFEGQLEYWESRGWPSVALSPTPCAEAKMLLRDETLLLALFWGQIHHNEKCPELFRHLNNCYHCASTFAEVLREYHNSVEF